MVQKLTTSPPVHVQSIMFRFYEFVYTKIENVIIVTSVIDDDVVIYCISSASMTDVTMYIMYYKHN